ncbi:hypothetical protein JHK85_043709 [Glycine max]|nr:hypothetical protein JHK85_043709 [Glycine max]
MDSSFKVINSAFTNYHIINKFGSDVEAVEDPDGHAIKFYDPLPSREYVRLIKVALLKMREALAQALKDRRYAENETMNHFFYKKATSYESPQSHSPPPSTIRLSSHSNTFGDHFLRKLDEEVVTPLIVDLLVALKLRNFTR